MTGDPIPPSHDPLQGDDSPQNASLRDNLLMGGASRGAFLSKARPDVSGMIDAVRAFAQRIAPSRLIAIAEICLVLLLAFLSAQILWTWATPLPSADGSLAAFRPQSSSSMPSVTSYALRFDPFHRDAAPVVAEAAAQVTVLENAPETALDLKLYGVRAFSDPAEGSAIIRTPDHEQGAFTAGMTVLENVTLAGIFPDRVVISRNGVQESLYLDESVRGAAPSSNAASARPALRAEQASSPAKPLRSAASATPPRVAASVPAVQKPAPAGQGVANMPALFRTLGLKPQLERGAMNGLYVSGTGNASLLARLGLQEGDIVRAVDGIRLTGFQVMSKLHERLEEEDNLSVVISRDGREETLDLELAGLRP